MKRIAEKDLERIRQRHERDITHARRFCKVATRPEQDRAALLQQISYLAEQRIQEQQQLAAAEARATEAAAEAGKWQQRHGELQQELAEQEVQTLALVQACGQHSTALARTANLLCALLDEDAIDREDTTPAYTIWRALADYLVDGKMPPDEARPAARAPVAPQQQEGGGQ